MKNLLLQHGIILLLILYALPLSAQRYELVWSDEFNANELDTETWNIWKGSAFNNELQCYTDQDKNIQLEDGKLMLTAQREQVQCANLLRSYSSGRISTDTLNAGWEYGRFEISAKMPAGTGFWPAFWLMPAKLIGWPRGGEIDIMEYRGNLVNETNAAIHYWREGCTGNSATCRVVEGQNLDTGLDLSADFNVYALEWTPSKLIWYFNEDPYFEIDLTTISAEYNPFTGPFYIILNLAVGGNYLPNPTPSTVFPQSFTIDYVRVFQDTNQKPEVDITTIDTTYAAGSPIEIKPTVIDTDGSIERVDYFLDGELIQSVNQSPFYAQLDPIIEGCYELQVVAYDNDSAASESHNQLVITIGEGCTNKAYESTPPVIPAIIPFWRYNHGGQNVAYFETTPLLNIGSTDDTVPRAFEGVDIMAVYHPDTDFAVFESVTGEWMRYEVESPESGPTDWIFSLASDINSSFDFEVNGVQVGSFNRIRTNGDPVERVLNNIELQEGLNDIKITTRIGNITWFTMDVSNSEPVSIDNLTDSEQPVDFLLLKSYPNPFNPSTVVQLELPESLEITLAVYALNGARILTLHQGLLPQGSHEFKVDMTSFSSGIYFAKVTSSQETQVLPITLLK